MIKQFFDRRGEKRSLNGAKTRLFNEVYRKIAKSECKFIFSSFLKHKNLSILLLGISLLFSGCQQNKLLSKQPNIILIVADDLGIGDLSCYGSTYNYTPHIDGLAKSGMRFTNFYANSSVCSPTRAAILTGQYPHKVGVKGAIRTKAQYNFGNLDDEVDLISDHLKKINYHTSYIGKWHLGLNSPDLPNDRGFNSFKGFIGDMVDSYWHHQRHNINYMRSNETEIKTEGHLTFEYSKWAVKAIKKLSRKSNPFFLMLSYNAPHQPIEAPNEWIDSVKLRIPDATEKQIKYTAFIEYFDWNVGKVIKALKKEKLYDHSLIIFVSDNGGAVRFGSDVLQYKGAKGTLYEGGIRIPFIVSHPDKIPQQSISTIKASTIDVLPTLLKYTNFTQSYTSDGHAIVDELLAKSSNLDQPNYPTFFIREDNNLFLKAVIQNNWKLIQNGTGVEAKFELYQLPDEGELINQKHSEKLKELKVLLNNG